MRLGKSERISHLYVVMNDDTWEKLLLKTRTPHNEGPVPTRANILSSPLSQNPLHGLNLLG